MQLRKYLRRRAALVLLTLASGVLFASSHMDAPLITLDDAANTTDVYAFRSANGGVEYLTTALGVYPFEEPGIGPNKHNFDDDVLYEIHVALGDDVAAGRKTISYEFRFTTTFQNENTILQSYLPVPGGVANVGDAAQNLVQSYTVNKVDHRTGAKMDLGVGQTLLVPPNNQGLITPKYNMGNDGEMPARPGVDSAAELDDYTSQTIYNLADGYGTFAGQREDGFYADIQSIFDIDFTFGGPNKPFDSQGGFNIHMIALNIPVDELGGDQQVVGVYATTSRRRVVVRLPAPFAPVSYGRFVQVGRQGNPLFNEGFVAIADKDLYSRTSPTGDAARFSQYALEPELAAVLVPLLGLPADRTSNRADIAGIYIPDLIKVDLSTGPARLTGATDDAGFSRLGVFGNDVLTSAVQPGFPIMGVPPGTIPGGWPNGRRFGDDVVDIAVSAALSDLRNNPINPATDIVVGGDRVDANDITYNKVFPYAGTPLNGRNHTHH